MKKIQILFAALCFFPFLVSASRNHNSIQVEAHTMEMQGDSICLNMSIILHGRPVLSNRSLILTPVLRDSDHVTELPSVLVNGRHRQRIFHRAKVLQPEHQKPYYQVVVARRKSADSLSYVVKVPYENWMDAAKVYLRQHNGVRSNSDMITNVAFSGWSISPPYKNGRFLGVENYVVPSPESVKMRVAIDSVSLDFRQNESRIDLNYGTNRHQMKRIYNSLLAIENNPNLELSGIELFGFASPEGSPRLNQLLSLNRAMALKRNLRWFFNISPSLFDGANRFDRVSGNNRFLVPFSKSRKVVCRIRFVVRKYSLEEARKVYDKDPSLLSLNELFMVAESFGRNTPLFDAVIEKMLALFPNDTTTNINAAAVLLRLGEIEKAGSCLKMCADNPASFNNLGAYYMQLGDFEKAKEYLNKASLNGVAEADRNLKVLRSRISDDSLVDVSPKKKR